MAPSPIRRRPRRSRQDILAYCRTLSLEQLQGPSALQHLREFRRARVARTNGAAKELVIETMVVQ
jgi:flagellar FliL protein